MRNVTAFLLLVLAFVLGSWLGWWAIPLVAALWAALRPRVRRPLLSATLAASLAWLVWLLFDWVTDASAFGRLRSGLSGAMQLPGVLLLVLTLLFPALLAWSAAAVVCRLVNAPRIP